MIAKPHAPKVQQPARRLSESGFRLHQIDAEILRLSKQLEYLKQIRVQYAKQAEAESVTKVQVTQRDQ
jgi:hypothetical protein